MEIPSVRSSEANILTNTDTANIGTLAGVPGKSTPPLTVLSPSRRPDSVYTPDFLADWMALKLGQLLGGKRKGIVMDPACGDGALLRAARRVVPAGIGLIGVDIESNAIRDLCERQIPNCRGFVDNVLKPASGKDPVPELKGLATGQKIIGIIANPPWSGALRDQGRELKSRGLSLASGQFDTYDLFFELSIKSLPKYSVGVFVVPDSLFLPEHAETRKFILENTRMHLVARVGEGFFPGVCRGAVVLALEKRKDNHDWPTRCFRLRSQDRQSVLRGEESLEVLEEKHGHVIAQDRFQSSPDFCFDIDSGAQDKTYLSNLDKTEPAWPEIFQQGRGVEISKNGKAICCKSCGFFRPAPRVRGTRPVCVNCGGKGFSEECFTSPSRTIAQGWSPLITGTDVTRYSCEASRSIQLDLPGINYKHESIYAQPKLLIRKTGLGLNASVDESGSHTTQVVYHYLLKSDCPKFLLYYALGVLSSRVMLTFFLKRYGELEWRSHPYVTTKTISKLPLPLPLRGHWSWRQCKAIASRSRKLQKAGGQDFALDLEIERLVAGLFGLNEEAFQWYLEFLHTIDKLAFVNRVIVDPREVGPPIKVP